MPPSSSSLDTIFCAAVDIASASDRAAYILRACGADQDLRARVERLVAAHFRAGDFLALPAARPGAAAETTPSAVSPAVASLERPGASVGPYYLLERLGEGGMGTVFLAQQHQPVQRKVALKIIKQGLDSAQVIARFEQEQQTLALMDHPNIAKVHDAGTTAAGRPYFVMELVQGMTITKYCDQERLTPRERLELFIPVCQAVQHAHQKGIIHRDLKPSNVLIGLYDGKPVPKVIDFGVAKATAQKLTERTLFTEVGVLVGTLEYMAPEQAELNNIDIDTRADIYALGVLLYELLTGSPPFSSKQLRDAAFTEMLRIIREVEPPRPSTRLSSCAELPAIAARRRLEPRKLTRLVSGDLDWVVMKCLEKERSRRYETANGLALELQRYLAEEPVLAGPPSAGYRLRKFVRRNRGRVVAAGALLLALVGGVVGTSLGLIQAESAWRAEAKQRSLAETKEQEAREAATAERLAREAAEKATGLAQTRLGQVEKANAILSNIFRDLDPRTEEKGGQALRVQLGEGLAKATRELEGQATGDPLVLASLQEQLGHSLVIMGYAREAIEVLGRARATRTEQQGADHPETLVCMNCLAGAYREAGRPVDAIHLLEEVLPVQKVKRGTDHHDTLATMDNLASAYVETGRPRDALHLFQEVVTIRKDKFGPRHRDTLMSMSGLAMAYKGVGQPAEALRLHEQVVTLSRASLGPDHPDTLQSLHNLAGGYQDAGRFADAIKLCEELLPARRGKLGPFHPGTLSTMNLLGTAYQDAKRLPEAQRLYEVVVPARKAKLGPDHPDTLVSMNNLASVYHDLNRLPEAIKLYEELIPAQKTRRGPNHPETLTSINNLAMSYRAVGRLDEAIKLCEEVLRARQETQGVDHPDTLTSMNNLAATYWRARRLDRSVPMLEEALRLSQATKGLDHPSTLLLQANLGVNYRDAGRLPEGIAQLEEALRRGRARPDGFPADLDWAPATLAETYDQAGRYADSEPYYRTLLEQARTKFGGPGLRTAGSYAVLALNLLHQKKYADAEPVLRDCLKALEQQPNEWGAFWTKAMLGGALAGQKKYVEAEPLLLQGYRGMKERAAKVPPSSKARLVEALEQLVQLYEATDRKDEAARWRKELEEAKAAAKPPPKP